MSIHQGTNIVDLILDFIKSVGDVIKKIWVAILSFTQHICDFFRNASRLKKIKNNSNIIATSIKRKLNDGDYVVVNCLYDQAENKVVDYKRDAEVITAEKLDATTRKMFGRKNMLVLR